jgi:hypothetical protein
MTLILTWIESLHLVDRIEERAQLLLGAASDESMLIKGIVSMASGVLWRGWVADFRARRRAGR